MLWAIAVLSTVAGVVAVLALLRRRFAVVEVGGDSMVPSFRPGDRVLVRRSVSRDLRTGSVVVFRWPMNSGPPGRDWPPAQVAGGILMIKRLAGLPGDTVPAAMRTATKGVAVIPPGMAVVTADNPAGTDSRHWGFIRLSQVLGSVVRDLGSSSQRAAAGYAGPATSAAYGTTHLEYLPAEEVRRGRC